jgi:hypothetical protein
MPAAGNLRLRPIIGGLQTAATGQHATLYGTLGLVYEAGYFATAGHAVGEVDSFVGQPGTDDMVGRVESNFLSGGVDIALIRVLVGVGSTPGMVWVDPDLPAQAVTFERTERPEEGERLWLQGAQSGKVECNVYLTDVTINEPVTNQQVTNVVLLNLRSQTQPGDSGAPVIGEESNLCYGIYGGRVVYQSVTYGWFIPFDNIEWA